MNAIQTRYFGPTNVKGARIKATCETGSITIGYPHELSGMACHALAAKKLVEKLGFTNYGELLGGQLKNKDYVFVFNNDASKT